MELCETGIHQIPSSLASVVTLVPVLSVFKYGGWGAAHKS